MLAKRRTFVLCRHTLFAEAIKALLDNQEAVDLVGVETDELRAKERIKRLKPDIVLVETGDEGVSVDTVLSYVVRECPHSRIVGLSQEQNEIGIYYGHQRRVREADDLVAAISES